MKLRRKVLITCGALGVLMLITGTVVMRSYRLWSVARDTRSQIRYLIENGGTIGEVPASSTFSAGYLQTVFGENADLLRQLKSVVHEGLAEDPALNLGEVAAMIVTHRLAENGEVEDVVAHVVGGFPIDQRKPGFHRDGYLRNLTDPQLWNWGNTALSFLGRDMVLFAGSDEIFEAHSFLLESILNGNILPFAESLDRPIYFTVVLPNPKRALPPQLRGHVQAVIMKGYLTKYDGSIKALVLTPSPKSSRYALALMDDMRTAATVGLKTRWKGVERDTPWGPMIDPWWSFEMVQTLEASTLEREGGMVRFHTDFKRVMVNVVLKTMERMGRDLAAMRGVEQEKKDPRLVDAELRARKPLHYWSESHRWGPNWPVPPKETNALVTADSGEANL